IFFFFQAEDGIRDKLVTGVQTCALPISFRTTTLKEQCICRTNSREKSRSSPGRPKGSAHPSRCTWRPKGRRWSSITARASPARRSEERRVGKEWRRRGGGAEYQIGEDRQ